MKNKRNLFLFILIPGLLLTDCKKEKVRDNTAPQALYDVLTSDTLKFESYIIKWNTSSADTIYQRGSNSNRLNFDTAWLKFDKDGTYHANFSQDHNYAASWEFLDNGSTLRLWSDARNFDQEYTVVSLSQDTVEWVDPKLDNLFYRFSFK